MKALEWGVVITILFGAISTAVTWGEMRGADETLREHHIADVAEIEKLDARVHVIETSRAIETQINNLANEVAGMKVELRKLTEERRRR